MKERKTGNSSAWGKWQEVKVTLHWRNAWWTGIIRHYEANGKTLDSFDKISWCCSRFGSSEAPLPCGRFCGVQNPSPGLLMKIPTFHSWITPSNYYKFTWNLYRNFDNEHTMWGCCLHSQKIYVFHLFHFFLFANLASTNIQGLRVCLAKGWWGGVVCLSLRVRRVDSLLLPSLVSWFVIVCVLRLV